MSVPVLVPLVLRDCELLFGEDAAAPDFRHHTTTLAWTPTGTPIRIKGLGKRSFIDAGDVDWSLDLAVAESDDADSLAEYCREHAGETVKVVTRARAGAGPSYTSRVTIPRIPVGGAGLAEIRHTVSMPAESEPVKAAA